MLSNSNLSMSLFELFSTYDKYVISYREFVQLTIQNNNKYPESAKNAILFLTDFVAENFKRFENNSFHPVISTLIFSETYEVMVFLEQITGYMKKINQQDSFELFDVDFYNFIHTFKLSVELNDKAGLVKLFYYDETQKDLIYFPSTHTNQTVDDLDKKINKNLVLRQLFLHLQKLINTFEKYINNFSFTFNYFDKINNSTRKTLNGSLKNYINSTIDHIVFENVDTSLAESFLIGLAYNLNTFYKLTHIKVNENSRPSHIIDIEKEMNVGLNGNSPNDYSFLICNLFVILMYNSLLLVSKNYDGEFYNKINSILFNNS